jgi:hypothetical protein
LATDKCGCGLGAGELVGLGQHDQELQALFDPRADDVQQDVVEFGQAKARVTQQHDAAQVLARHQVVGHHLLPADLVLLGHGRIPVTRQVGQDRVGDALLAQRKQVDVLGAARLAGCEGQLLLLRQVLMQVDLPAFERPTKAISGTRAPAGNAVRVPSSGTVRYAASRTRWWMRPARARAGLLAPPARLVGSGHGFSGGSPRVHCRMHAVLPTRHSSP